VILPVASFLLLLAFLVALGLLALAVTKVVAPDGRGHARGVGGGCAAVLAVLLMCLLGLLGLSATVGALALETVSSWNPVRRLEISRERPATRDPISGSAEDSAVSARVTVRGESELAELLGSLFEASSRPTVHHRSDRSGREFEVYEFRLPIRTAELERFERDVRREFGGLELELPQSVEIDFR
jgi:hypothetical protein